MTIMTDWDDSLPNVAIRLEFGPDWGWGDFDDVVPDVLNLMESSENKVGLILDMLNTLDVPPGALESLWAFIEQAPENLGRILIVATDPAVSVPFQVLARVDRRLGSYYTVMHTLEDARQRLGYRYAHV